VRLCLSPDVLAEWRDVLQRPKLRRKFPILTPEWVNSILTGLQAKAEVFPEVPRVVELPRDPKDEPYLNLAVASAARYLISRDKDLLDLMDRSLPEGNAFRARFPQLLILDPVPSAAPAAVHHGWSCGVLHPLVGRVPRPHRPGVPGPRSTIRDFAYGVHVSLGEDREPQWWCFVRLVEGEALVSGSVGAFGLAPNEFHEEHFAGTGGLPTWRHVPNVENTPADRYALQLVDEQVSALVRRGDLVESWHLVYERAAGAIHRLTNPIWRGEPPILPLDVEQPITSQEFRRSLLGALKARGLAPQRMQQLIIVQGRLQAHSGAPVDLGQLDADILWLERQGRPVHGPLLPGPDVPYDAPVPPRGYWTWDFYTDAQLGEAARRSLDYLIEAYCEIAERNFPDLCSEMQFYQAMPVQVECAVDRRGDSLSLEDADWAFVTFRRSTNATTVTVVVVSAQSVPEAVEELERIRDGVDDEDVFSALGTAVTLFIRGKDWRDHLLGMVARDFEAAWQGRYLRDDAEQS